MKNAKRKPMRVVLLRDGKPEPGEYQIFEKGAAGFRVGTLARVLYWADKGKTWLPVEEDRIERTK